MINPDRLIQIFDEAKARPVGAERDRFLAEICRDEPELIEQVVSLLQSHEGSGDFLKHTLLITPPVLITEKPGDIIGRYKLLEKIGEGGCGVVYVAEQTVPVRRRVALKVIKLGMDTQQVVARFEAERQALAMMDHPNIAKVLDAGATDTGRPYFVMELVRGIRITDYCDQNNLSTKERLDLFIKVCQAIQHAHQKGIIHRDIKPSNILVTLHDGVPVPKVIDFGIAKATEGRLTDNTVYTQLHQFIGTPAYMSPEQAEMSGLDIDTRSDIYSLGVLLYELLAGSTPFDAQELMASGIDAMRKTIREQEPVRPSTRLSQTLVADDVRRLKSSSSDTRVTEEEVGGLPRRLLQIKETITLLRGDLDWIVMKCLEKDRTRRYETANDLAADLKRHLSNEPVVARPPSAAYKFQKAFRRNKLVFAAAAAVAIALLIGLSVATVMFFRERVAKLSEQRQRLEAQAAQKAAETERQRADLQARKASESQQQSRRLLYAADMNLAQQTLKLNNLGRARRLLDRHRPKPGEEDLRGWEWRYLWQMTRSSALVTLTNRSVRGFDVSFSPDGTRLAVGWFDGHVDLWDVPNRRLIRALTDREHPYEGRVAFSPVRNLLAATSEPKVVALYDLDSGRESILWRSSDQGAGNVRDLTFSQDGSKVVIYAASNSEVGDAVSVVDVSSSKIESYHTNIYSQSRHHGAVRISPDNQRLYLAGSAALNYRYNIQCIDLATGNQLWQTESLRDLGLTTLAISPDGRVLASGSGFEDPAIRVWDAATGKLLHRLDGHTGFVFKLAFTTNGRKLISAASDQSIRFWDTSTWTETHVLRGHTDEVHAVAISEPAQLVASAGKDGNLMLWRDDGKVVTDEYIRLPEELWVLPLNRSRLLLLSSGKPPQLVDLKRDSPPVAQLEIGSSDDLLDWSGSNILCHWNGTNQILVRELRGEEFIQRAAISIDSGTRPLAATYNAARQLLAWSEGSSSNSVFLASLATPGRRIELKCDVAGLVPFRFSEDGNFLATVTTAGDFLRVWRVETEQIIASSRGNNFRDATFAADGKVLVVAIRKGNDHEIEFYDLVHYDQPPRRVPGRDVVGSVTVSPDGKLVALSTTGGLVQLFDPVRGELIESIHGHLNAAYGLAFSPDGQRLISGCGGREAVKLWDVGTRQELLTLSGTGSQLGARWSSDGDVILAGSPWQAWRAPSWAEIESAEKSTSLKELNPAKAP